ncbi:hypothetical protein J1N35_034329 [Gossypium stocksii]|uniref:Uncharacterized protein n=1 Tax=Gossypium stocksii TaxID=47602 RepID=A0A9D3USN4_9ROSI|nr:hypothetical protein J1N35_034329 [Gossypium stocksii]
MHVLRVLELSMSEGVSSVRMMVVVAASDSQCKKGSGRVPTRSGLVVFGPKFKRRKVSTIQDVLPGFGRVTAPNSGSSKQITVYQYSQGKW